MCRVLGVSTSGYYAWRKRGRSRRSQENAVLLERITVIHEQSRGTYGVPRIHAELKAEGVNVGHNRVARLMRQAGLEGVSRRKGRKTTTRDEKADPAPDLVEREFTADSPDELWVADITYIPTRAGFVYLAVVVDAFSRRVVGWALAGHLRAELVLEALEMAIGKRSREAGVRPSMGSVGDCYDNAMCESFFATLECELFDRRTFSSRAEARLAVFEFIEGWYNPHRRHSSIGYESPINFERTHAAQVALSSETEKGRELIPTGEQGGERT